MLRLAIAALLLLASAPAEASPLVVHDTSSITGDCSYSGGSAPDPDPLSISNPHPGHSWSVAGSYCGFDYRLDITFEIDGDRGVVTMDARVDDMVARDFDDPQHFGVLTHIGGFLSIDVALAFAGGDHAVLYDTESGHVVVVPDVYGDRDTWVPNRNEVYNLTDLDFTFGAVRNSTTTPRHSSDFRTRTITVQLVPEPDTAALVAFGLALVVRSGRGAARHALNSSCTNAARLRTSAVNSRARSRRA